MALNVNNRLGNSLYEALSSILVPHPSDKDTIGNPILVEARALATPEQTIKIKEYINIFISEIVTEFVEHAKISIKMTEHTHTLTLVPVSGGGYTVTGTTDIPNGAIEIGNPENTPISTGGIE